jgi:hypothetical protein
MKSMNDWIAALGFALLAMTNTGFRQPAKQTSVSSQPMFA